MIGMMPQPDTGAGIPPSISYLGETRSSGTTPVNLLAGTLPGDFLICVCVESAFSITGATAPSGWEERVHFDAFSNRRHVVMWQTVGDTVPATFLPDYSPAAAVGDWRFLHHFRVHPEGRPGMFNAYQAGEYTAGDPPLLTAPSDAGGTPGTLVFGSMMSTGNGYSYTMAPTADSLAGYLFNRLRFAAKIWNPGDSRVDTTLDMSDDGTNSPMLLQFNYS